MFRRVHDARHGLEPTNYFSSLDGYLAALQTINPSMDQSLEVKSKDRFLLGLPVARTSIEVTSNSLKDASSEIAVPLGLHIHPRWRQPIERNVHGRSLSSRRSSWSVRRFFSLPWNLHLWYWNVSLSSSGSQPYKLVCSFNLIRCLLDGKHVSTTQYVFDYLETVRRQQTCSFLTVDVLFSIFEGASRVETSGTETAITLEQFSSNSFS